MAEGTAGTALGVTEGYTDTLPRDTREEPGTLPRDTDKNGAVAPSPTLHLEQLHYHLQYTWSSGTTTYTATATLSYTALYRPAAPLPPPGATALNAYHRHCIVAFVTVVVVFVVVVVRVSIVTVIIFASNSYSLQLNLVSQLDTKSELDPG